MLPARDNMGAVRILELGNLPFTKALRDFHADKFQERAAHEHRSVSFQMVVDDVYAVGKGHLGGRPAGGLKISEKKIGTGKPVYII